MLADDLRDVRLDASPGCAVGVLGPATSTPEFVCHGHGVGDRSPISIDTVWEAASLSKPVVALLALERSIAAPELLTSPLVTSGERFGLPDDDRWADLTLLDAINHTTGFPNWRPQGEPLSFDADPGTPGYSGEGYELLLAELTARSDLPADVALGQHLQRLGMQQSSFTADLAAMSNVAIGHDTDARPLPKTSVGVARASGSLHTTVRDYVRFLSLIARPGAAPHSVLRTAAARMADRTVETLPGHGRTLGWAFTSTSSGDVLWQHGDNPGFKHIAAVNCSTGAAVVVFTNSDEGQAIYRDICKRILDVDVW